MAHDQFVDFKPSNSSATDGQPPYSQGTYRQSAKRNGAQRQRTHGGGTCRSRGEMPRAYHLSVAIVEPPHHSSLCGLPMKVTGADEMPAMTCVVGRRPVGREVRPASEC